MTATLTNHTGAAAGTSKRAFARHFGEMVLAMFLGMAVLGGLAYLVFAAFGSSVSGQSGGLQVMLMGFNMTIPMVAWMSHRGHNRTRTMEMAASMIVPTVFAAVLAWAGVLGESGALALQHVVMIPAMFAVMVWRYEEYAYVHP